MMPPIVNVCKHRIQHKGSGCLLERMSVLLPHMKNVYATRSPGVFVQLATWERRKLVFRLGGLLDLVRGSTGFTDDESAPAMVRPYCVAAEATGRIQSVNACDSFGPGTVRRVRT
ncbi:hypothetical protein GCM10022243_09660 [Saccharothrix violaceirubra]